MTNYLVCATHGWNQQLFVQRAPRLPGAWRLFSRREELTLDALAEIQPRYTFFLHWSWIVPAVILNATEAVCFHMTDLPYGRGGSPLQNLILAGHKSTMLSALRMTEELDAGPIYMKRPLELNGRAQNIYERASTLAFDMIELIVANNPVPQPQVGETTTFRRRTPAESQLPADADLNRLHDYIRMLDADGYPKAFIEYGGFHMEFGNADLHEGSLTATIKITSRKVDD
jgi:methionyl-tRNA formyltransferase